MSFEKATKKQAKLRADINGPSGSGKTYTALSIGRALVGSDGKIAVIDTEHGSASKYADKFDFDVMTIKDNYHPDRLMGAIKEADAAHYDLLIVDSLSHFWNGPGGMLELVDYEVKRQKANGQKPDSFAAWKSIDAIYRRTIQSFLSFGGHFICTLRAKTEYEKSTDERGKSVVKKLGMSPEMRNGFEYEFDVEGMLDQDHVLTIGKTRCPGLDGKFFEKPGEDVAAILRDWLTTGEAPTPTTVHGETSVPFDVQLQEAATEADLKRVAAAASLALQAGTITRAQYDTYGSLFVERMKGFGR